ncbi:MAG: hypothetical protein IRY99_03075 [Isosphaeraceae bacterium]|nr:hypothetical protein [Isosphaeraceae bacterium]
MTLVKIGQVVVNMDRVTSISDLSTVDSAGTPIQKLLRIEFDKGHAIDVSKDYDALDQWLNGNVTQAAAS